MLEMMMAIFVILVGVLGVMSLIQRVLFFGSISHSRLAAAYLAQEGIEIIRNIRDTNWLEARTVANDWDEGLTNCSTGCAADYNHSYGPNLTDPDLSIINPDTFLNIDGNGFYSYSSGTQTKFKRKIKISSISPDALNVLVEISWTDKEATYSLSVQENLYNWR